jgi:uncharacterized protein YacL
MAHNQPTDGSRTGQLREELLQPTIKLVLGLIVLLVIRGLLTWIPGTNTIVSSAGVTVATVLYSAVTLVIFGVILKYVFTAGAVLARVFEEIPEIKRVVQLVGVLIVTVWAYQLLNWLPYFRTNPAVYNSVFLIIGVGVVGWLGYIFYMNIDDLSQHISELSMDTWGTLNQDNTATASDSGQSGGGTVNCPDCGDKASKDAEFCSSCGTSLANRQDSPNRFAGSAANEAE